MAELGRLLVVLGGALLLIGLLLLFAGRLHIPLGRLPGDITYRGKHSAVFFPLTTCILLSLLVSLIIYLINRFHH